MEMDFEATADQYDAVDEALDARGQSARRADRPHAPGSMATRCTSWTSGSSAEAFGAFAESRLGPAMAETLGDDAPEAPEPKFTELHNAYCVVSAD